MKFPIPQDWDGVTWCRWSICWPDSESWRGLLRGFITLPQRGWTWDERTGNILAVQEIGREITAQNLPLNGVIMACNDTNLADSFNNIAAAIQLLANKPTSAACCDSPEIVINNVFQGSTTPGVGGNSTPIFGTQPPIGLNPGDFPVDSGSYAAYDAEKCRNAHMLVDALIGSLNNLAGFEYMKSVALVAFIGAAIFASIIFPPSIIPLMIGVLIVLASEVYLLSQAADYCQEHRDELICMLYEGENTEGILSAFADFIDIMIGLFSVSSPLGVAIKTVMMLIFNTDTVNKLFTSAAAAGYANADCSSCGCNTTGQAEFYQVNGATWGTGDLSVDCQERELAGGEYAAGGYWFVGIMNTGANDLRIESISADPGLTNAGAFGGMSGFGVFDVTPNNNIYFGGNSTPFTMIVKISGLDTVNGV